MKEVIRSEMVAIWVRMHGELILRPKLTIHSQGFCHDLCPEDGYGPQPHIQRKFKNGKQTGEVEIFVHSWEPNLKWAYRQRKYPLEIFVGKKCFLFRIKDPIDKLLSLPNIPPNSVFTFRCSREIWEVIV